VLTEISTVIGFKVNSGIIPLAHSLASTAADYVGNYPLDLKRTTVLLHHHHRQLRGLDELSVLVCDTVTPPSTSLVSICFACYTDDAYRNVPSFTNVISICLYIL
jgi:hypothetical protein